MAERKGQATLEFVMASAAVMLPVTFALIFTSQLLWIWHSVNDFTRTGAVYATTHCWESSSGNVLDYMRANVPPMVNQDQFVNGPAQIAVNYFAEDPATRLLTPFQCNSECSPSCIPDTVTVTVTGFEFRTFVTSLGLPPVVLPNFQASLPVESAGCDPEQGVCLP